MKGCRKASQRLFTLSRHVFGNLFHYRTDVHRQEKDPVRGSHHHPGARVYFCTAHSRCVFLYRSVETGSVSSPQLIKRNWAGASPNATSARYAGQSESPNRWGLGG